MKYLFVDVETTGLDPARDALLEVSAILTNDLFSPLSEFHEVIRTTEWDIDNEYVLAMHAKNNLMVESICAHQGQTLPNVQARFHAWWDKAMFEHVQDPTEKIEFAGDSPHFDRAWMRRWMPGIWDNRVSHHHLDVSALGRVLTRVGSYPGYLGKADVAHRAREDNLDAIRRAEDCCSYIESAVADAGYDEA